MVDKIKVKMGKVLRAQGNAKNNEYSQEKIKWLKQ